jgi:putative Mn2+ efflux pump MntP
MIYLFFILAISLSIDALGAGIVYGMRGIIIPVPSKIIICFFSILYSGFAIYAGSLLSQILPSKIASYIGIGILSFLGLYMIIKVQRPAEADVDKSGIIEIKEAILLGLALSLDSIGVGIGAGFADIKSLFIPVMVGLFQLIFLSAGIFIGNKFKNSFKLNERTLSIFAGILLLTLAFLRLLG